MGLWTHQSGSLTYVDKYMAMLLNAIATEKEWIRRQHCDAVIWWNPSNQVTHWPKFLGFLCRWLQWTCQRCIQAWKKLRSQVTVIGDFITQWYYVNENNSFNIILCRNICIHIHMHMCAKLCVLRNYMYV